MKRDEIITLSYLRIIRYDFASDIEKLVRVIFLNFSSFLCPTCSDA